ncbi:MAG: MBL fold metallo-hydrolase [Oceanospirillaceae bacterium]|nr:MBL fold metallo-hydrolase [Oceanospirillaceae bacterium]
MKNKSLFLIALFFLGHWASAASLKTVKVAQDIYALVGPLEQRSQENLGNNATFGFIVSNEGVVLIDSGGTEMGAKAIELAIQQVTEQPIVAVINTGGQDHRWFGNRYFADKGAEIITARATAEDHQARQASQTERMQTLTQDAWEGTVPQVASRLIDEPFEMQVGEIMISIIPVGQAHTPNENIVWVADAGVLFTGDLVYVERMLSVGAQSAHLSWIEAFSEIEALSPDVIVPGHGHPTTLETARRDTLNYLVFLREEVGKILDEGGDMQSVSEIDQSQFSYLAVYDELQGANAQRVFEEMEWE